MLLPEVGLGAVIGAIAASGRGSTIIIGAGREELWRTQTSCVLTNK